MIITYYTLFSSGLAYLVLFFIVRFAFFSVCVCVCCVGHYGML